jgi:hypothetical protein
MTTRGHGFVAALAAREPRGVTDASDIKSDINERIPA